MKAELGDERFPNRDSGAYGGDAVIDWGGKVAAWFGGVAAASTALAALVAQTAEQPLDGRMRALFIALVVIASVSFVALLLTGPRALLSARRCRRLRLAASSSSPAIDAIALRSPVNAILTPEQAHAEKSMARDDGDYNPVASQRKIDKPSGILGRRRLRDSLPAVEYGNERVIVDADGHVRSGRGAAVADDRCRVSPGTWLSVDTGDHDITYRFNHREPDGSAGYDIQVDLTVRVSDAAEAVRRNVTGVRRYLVPELTTRISTALTASLQQDVATSVRKLNTGRDQIACELRQAMAPGSEIQVGGWLSATVTSISVRLDAATTTHYDHLVAAARDVEHARAEIGLRETWSKYLEPRMADPLKRAVATIAADPTQENIQRVAEQLDADERWRRGEVIALLKMLIDKDYVEDISQLSAIKAIVEMLQRSSGRADGGTPLGRAH